MDTHDRIPVTDDPSHSSEGMSNERTRLLRAVRTQQGEVAGILAEWLVREGQVPAGVEEGDLVRLAFHALIRHLTATARAVATGEEPVLEVDPVSRAVREALRHYHGFLSPLGFMRTGHLELDFPLLALWHQHFP